MTKEDGKDFDAMLHDGRGMPRIQTVTDPRTVERYGGCRMLLAPPLEYDVIMRAVPCGKVVTVGMIRDRLAEEHGADFTDPMTAGIFVTIAAWACHQRGDDSTPWWRTLKADGELNPKYPGGCEAQKERLESEGHAVVQKGRKNIRWFVHDYEESLFELRPGTSPPRIPRDVLRLVHIEELQQPCDLPVAVPPYHRAVLDDQPVSGQDPEDVLRLHIVHPGGIEHFPDLRIEDHHKVPHEEQAAAVDPIAAVGEHRSAAIE